MKNGLFPFSTFTPACNFSHAKHFHLRGAKKKARPFHVGGQPTPCCRRPATGVCLLMGHYPFYGHVNLCCWERKTRNKRMIKPCRGKCHVSFLSSARSAVSCVTQKTSWRGSLQDDRPISSWQNDVVGGLGQPVSQSGGFYFRSIILMWVRRWLSYFLSGKRRWWNELVCLLAGPLRELELELDVSTARIFFMLVNHIVKSMLRSNCGFLFWCLVEMQQMYFFFLQKVKIKMQ